MPADERPTVAAALEYFGAFVFGDYAAFWNRSLPVAVEIDDCDVAEYADPDRANADPALVRL